MLGEKDYSVGIFRSAVLVSGLPVVTGLAKRLPVGVAPHEVVVTTMRHDMVNDRCGHILSLCHTLHAQLVLPQVRFADTLPLAAVATLGGRRTVRVLAWFQCLPRHRRHLLRA